jgi:hypothetical protein
MKTTPSTPCTEQRLRMEALGFQLEETDRCGVSMWVIYLPALEKAAWDIGVRYDDAAVPDVKEVLLRVARGCFDSGWRAAKDEIRRALTL